MAFGSTSERLAFVLSLDANGAIRGFQNVGNAAERELGRADDRLDRLGSRMQGIGAGMLASSAIAGRALFGMAQASEEANLAVVRLQNSIDRSPELAGESASRFTDLAESIQAVTAADGDAIVAAEAMLGTFHLTGDEIEAVTPLVVDYARKFGVDLTTAAVQVGKALDGNIGALQRVGININEAAYEADSFTAVMDALRENVGGFAEAEGQTLAGQMERLKNQLGDVAEGMGVGVIGAFNDFFAGPALWFTNFVTNTAPGTQNLVGRIATIGTAAVGATGGLSLLAGSALKMRDRFTDATGALNNFGRAAQFAGLAAAAAIVVASIQSIDDEAQRMAATFERDVRGQLNDKTTFDGFIQGLAGVDAGIQDIHDSLTGSQAPWDIDRRAQLREGEEALRRVREEYGNLVPEIEELAEAEGISLDMATRQVVARHGQADAARQLADVVGEETAATLLNNDAVNENAEAQNGAAAAIERRNAALDELYEAVTGTFEAEIAHRDAQRASIEAQNELNQAIRDHGRDSWEAREATDRAAEALNDQAEAAVELFEQTAALNGETLTASERAAIHRQALEDMVATIDANSPLRHALDEHIARLDTIPRSITTAIGVDTSLFNTQPGARAAGGPISEGTPYWVGEQGPELIIPGQSGSVIANHMLDDLTGTAKSVGEVHFHIDGGTTSMAFAKMEQIARGVLDNAAWGVN